MRQLGLKMMETAHDAELNRSYSSPVMLEVESFFQLLPHPKPEIKVLGRTDWLPRYCYKLVSTPKIEQLEAPTNECFAKGVQFLGRYTEMEEN